MFTHYLTVAFRNIWRTRVSTLVAVVGLALGQMCFIAALAEALLMTHSDSHFAKDGRVQVVVQHLTITNNGAARTLTSLSSPWPLAGHIANEFPDVEAVARMRSYGEISVSAEGNNMLLFTVAVDPAFLRIIDLPFAAGAPQHALDNPRSVVLTESAAQRLFGTTAAIGRNVILRGLDLTVTGIVRAIPGPSHLARSDIPFALMVSMDVHEELTRRQTGKEMSPQDWMGASVRTYVLVPQSGYSAAVFNERLAALVARVAPSDLKVSYTLRPLPDLALVITNSLLGRVDEPSVPNNVILIIIGGVIVALACVNYANLATAQVGSRIKEAGLRKAVGARTGQLLMQHLTETSLKVLAAFALAFGLVILPVQVLTSLLGFNIATFLFALPVFWVSLAIALVAVILVAGFYPAVLMARISTASASRSNLSPQDKQFGRSILVGFQFVVVSIFLILSLVVIAENKVLRETGPKASADPLVVISNNLRESGVAMDVLRAELLRAPGIRAVTSMQSPPWGLATQAVPMLFKPEGRVSFVLKQGVGEGFFDALDIKILAGRIFSAERDQGVGSDPTLFVSDNVVIDRKLASELASTPADAVGKTLYVANIADKSKPPQPRTVIGVVENASIKLISGPALQATVYGFDPAAARTAVIKLESSDRAKSIDEVWSKLAPTVALKRQFAEEIFETSFSYFNAVGSVIMGLAGFAFLIAIIGMLAIATHTMNRRRREIGIRKTLGSTVNQVTRLMLWSFSKPVVIASIIAWPLAFLAARLYLSMFVTRAALTPIPFVVGFVIVLGMTWLAVGRQAFTAARLNPGDVLHYE